MRGVPGQTEGSCDPTACIFASVDCVQIVLSQLESLSRDIKFYSLRGFARFCYF